MTAHRGNVAVIEDDEVLGASLEQRLRLEGYRVAWYRSGAAALRGVERSAPDAVLCDLRLGDTDGERVMREAFGAVGAVPVIFMTAYGSFEQAVRLVRQGARDYVIKPFDLDDLLGKLAAAVQPHGAAQRTQDPFALFGVSPAMARARRLLERAAGVATPVLLTGETGTGKEVAARFLASRGRGAGKPFVAVNCAGFTAELADSQLFGHEKGAFTGAAARHAGVFEQAGDGTLFLDEVAELPLELQAKLLRVVQDGEVRPIGAKTTFKAQARLVCATNQDLAAAVQSGRFRQDLYYRLSVIGCELPPLRERREEIAGLLDFLGGAIARELGAARFDLAPETVRQAEAFRWPGNVRELRNRLERAIALSEDGVIRPADLFPDLAPEQATGAQPPGSLAAARDAAEREHIERTLAACGMRHQETARQLGISRTTLWEKMKRHGLDRGADSGMGEGG
jgi:DNA-binding NtrC family response regulator